MKIPVCIAALWALFATIFQDPYMLAFESALLIAFSILEAADRLGGDE